MSEDEQQRLNGWQPHHDFVCGLRIGFLNNYIYFLTSIWAHNKYISQIEFRLFDHKKEEEHLNISHKVNLMQKALMLYGKDFQGAFQAMAEADPELGQMIRTTIETQANDNVDDKITRAFREGVFDVGASNG